jgi:hypothetical protein
VHSHTLSSKNNISYKLVNGKALHRNAIEITKIETKQIAHWKNTDDRIDTAIIQNEKKQRMRPHPVSVIVTRSI